MIKQFKQWFFHLQDFFFEAVVTVNLTTMLVLTTMFISVSNNLPNTAYVKMIDVWLIFNLMMPFMLVLLHTYMDSLRTDSSQEGEGRTINHHGKAVTVGEENVIEEKPSKTVMVAPAGRDIGLIHRNEMLELQVRSLFKLSWMFVNLGFCSNFA